MVQNKAEGRRTRLSVTVELTTAEWKDRKTPPRAIPSLSPQDQGQGLRAFQSPRLNPVSGPQFRKDQEETRDLFWALDSGRTRKRPLLGPRLRQDQEETSFGPSIRAGLGRDLFRVLNSGRNRMRPRPRLGPVSGPQFRRENDETSFGPSMLLSHSFPLA